MSEIKFTPVQRRIIESRASKILVSASAGTGKTTVMIQRVVALVEQGVPLENMLILAFNRLAAAEMRAKLFKKLIDTEGENAARARNEIAVADISTLHSWEANLIRTYFYRAGVSPAFRVLEEKEAAYYQRSVLDAVIAGYIKKRDEEFLELADIFSAGRTDRALREIIMSVYELAYKCAEPEAWLNIIAARGYIEEDLSEKIIAEYLADWRGWLCEEVSALREEMKGADAKLQAFADMLLADIAADCRPSFTLRFTPKTEADADLFGRLKAIKKKVTDEFKSKEKYRLPFAGDCLKYVQKLAGITLEFMKHYAEKKQSRDLLDYNDLEHTALKLLSDENVSREVRAKYKYVFVDEYQDINEIQDTIITRIDAENLFIVGDVKQSIYAFRLCEPEIFVNKRKAYGTERGCECYNLNDNFRSPEEILDLSNRVFSKIMTEKFGSVDYLKDGRFSGGTGKSVNPLPVTIHINTARGREAGAACGIYSVKNHNYENSEAVLAAREAHIIAEQIAAVLETQLYDKDKDVMRQAEYGDITVIYRARSVYYETTSEYLASLNIPIVNDRKTDLKDSLAVGMIVNLLNCINNMRDDYALAGLLRSGFYSFSDDELAAVRLCGKEHKFFFDAVISYAEAFKDALAVRLNAVISDLRRYTALAGRMTVADLLDEIYASTGICDLMGGAPDGASRRRELSLFRESARGFSAAESLPSYIDYITEADSLVIETGCAQNTDAVKIMTAHSAKGLEFPVVIYAGAGAQFNRADSKKPVQLNKLCGIGINGYETQARSVFDNRTRRAVMLVNEATTAAEEMRILYVALSRARQKLIVVGSASDISKKSCHHFAVRAANTPLEWILRGLNADEYIIHECGAENNHIDAAVTDKGNIPPVFAAADPVLKAAAESALAFEYPYGKPQPSKLSVTAVSAMTRDEENTERTAELFADTAHQSLSRLKGISPIDTGNAYHKVMQYIKTDNLCDTNIDSELDRLVKAGSISGLQRDIVIPQKIIGCVNSGLFSMPGKYFREMPFLINIEGDRLGGMFTSDKILVQGIIDLICLNGNEAVIADYKTGLLSDGYRRQLELYSLSAESILKKKVVKRLIYSFLTDEIIEV